MLLSHYTTYETCAKHILPTSQIRFSCLTKLNDPHEVSRRSSSHFSSDGDCDSRIFEIANRIRSNNIKTFCTSALVGDDDLMYCKSSHLSPMWTHYSKRYATDPGKRGCVLIFDKDELANEVNEKNVRIVKDDFIEYIPYGTQFNGNVSRFRNSPSDQQITELIENGAKDLWFKKQDQWSYESEYRILINTTEDNYSHVKYGKALKGIAIDCQSFHKLDPEIAAVFTGLKIPLICTYYDCDSGRYKTELFPRRSNN